MKSLKTLLFESPTEDWLDFVMSNRTNKDFNHDFDIVYGPVANDKVYAAFALYEGGIIDKQNLISELKAYKLVDQYLFRPNCKKVGQNSCNVLGDSKIRVFVICLSLFNY